MSLQYNCHYNIGDDNDHDHDHHVGLCNHNYTLSPQHNHQYLVADDHVYSTNNNSNFIPYDIHHQLHEDNLDHTFYHCESHDHMGPPLMGNVLPQGTSDSSSSLMTHLYAIPWDNVSTSCSPCISPHFISDRDLHSYFTDQLDQDFDLANPFNDH